MCTRHTPAFLSSTARLSLLSEREDAWKIVCWMHRGMKKCVPLTDNKIVRRHLLDNAVASFTKLECVE